MSIISVNNKRIAQNTLFLYFRQILVMAVSLYTVRVVFMALGMVDYGIYNVVGGFVAMFNILSGSLSIAISRFITYEMGQTDTNMKRLQRIFSSALIIQAGMGILISLLLSTCGVWFLEYKMVIPPQRLGAAVYILFFSAISFFISLLCVPFTALIIANEQMKAFAYISIVEAILKLIVAFLLVKLSFDKLVLYGFCMVIVSLIVGLFYAFYCKRHFKECCFTLSYDRNLLLRMFTFAGWAFLGHGSFVVKEHGVNILLNMFCGPAVNAARGITTQVTAAVTLFVSNFMQAINPQITKSFSSGDLSNMHGLIFSSSRFSFYLLLLLSLPLMKNIDYILSLWLVSVPEHAGTFIQLLLVFCLMDCLVTPLMTGLLAEGNIRKYEIALVLLNSVNVVFSYIALSNSIAPESVYIISILVEIAIIRVRIKLSNEAYGLPVRAYCVKVLSRAVAITTVAGVFTYFVSLPLKNAFANFIVMSVMIALVTAAAIYIMGLNNKEKRFIFNILRNRLFRFAEIR